MRTAEELKDGLLSCKRMLKERRDALSNVSKFVESLTPREWVTINQDKELIDLVQHLGKG